MKKAVLRKEIDFVKTGYRWIISKNLRKYLKQLPYFLLHNYPQKLDVYNRIRKINREHDREDKIQYNAFRSPSPMNELCDYINQWEKKEINWDRSLINNGHLLIDKEIEQQINSRDIERQIKKIYNEFDVDLRKTIDEDGDLKSLSEEYKSKLSKIASDENLLANYCIKVAYRSLSSDKTLCWMLFGDIMIHNLRNNSDERKEIELVKVDDHDPEAKEFLGKYYKLQLKNRQE